MTTFIKNEAQKIRWLDEYNYRVAANITEYHIISKNHHSKIQDYKAIM